MSNTIFKTWTPAQQSEWGKAPLRLTHTLATHDLFKRAGLAALIDRYPREHYALIEMGPQGSPRRTWREGDKGNLSGEDVIAAIASGRMWLNLRNVGLVDTRYRDVLDQIFEEVRENVPGYETYNRTSGILISSPNAQVYYHCDLPGQSLWQIEGRKRVYVYPNKPPYLTPEQLERIALFEVEVDMRYEAAYDAGATVFEIGPGDMLHWPLNSPHRVENLDCLNVSMTTEYWTQAVRRQQMLTMGNGIVRHKLGLTPRGHSTQGAAFWTKAALQAGFRRAGLLTKERRARRPIEFILDKNQPGVLIDVPRQAAE
jgi:hypothetical protein